MQQAGGKLAPILIPLSVLKRSKSEAPEEMMNPGRNRVKFLESEDGYALLLSTNNFIFARSPVQKCILIHTCVCVRKAEESR